MSCLEVTAQERPGPAPILGVYSGLNMHPLGSVLNSLGDQCMEPAIVRINFRALPRRSRTLTVRLRRVAPGMLDNWFPGYQLLVKSVKVSLRLISLGEGVNVRANHICQGRATGFPADIFQGTLGIVIPGFETILVHGLLIQRCKVGLTQGVILVFLNLNLLLVHLKAVCILHDGE